MRNCSLSFLINTYLSGNNPIGSILHKSRSQVKCHFFGKVSHLGDYVPYDIISPLNPQNAQNFENNAQCDAFFDIESLILTHIPWETLIIDENAVDIHSF